MSYTVLARRYRSASFDDVVGQDHVAQTLKKAIASGRIAHAFLFCGTRGVGKTSMARILAKALNCQAGDGPTTEPCGKCASCLAVAAGQDMDVIEIDAASHTGVDNVRDIIDNARYRPAASRFKVYIIDEVHMLSKSAFNALLKTLEEPPSHVKFILATTEPEKVPATIVSRCQRYDFRSISTRQIAEHLAAICKGEKVEAQPDALLLIARAGAGSMRDALSLLDRLLSVGEQKLTAQTIEQLLGLPQSQLLLNLTDAIGRGDLATVLSATDQALQSGLSADALLAGLIDHLRTLLVLRVCGQSAADLIDAPATEELTAQATRFAPALLSQDIAILEELRRQLRTTQAGRALLDATMLRLAMAEQFQSIDAALAAPATPLTLTKSSPSSAAAEEGRGEGSRSAPAAPAPTAPKKNVDVIAVDAVTAPVVIADGQVSPASIDTSDPAAVWQSILALLATRGHALTSLLNDATFVGIEANRAILRYRQEHGTFLRMLERNGKKDLVRDAFTQLLGRPIALALELEPAADVLAPADSPSIASPPPTEARDETTVARQRSSRSAAEPEPAVAAGVPITAELRQSLRDADPLLRRVMDDLAAEIVKVE